jgi:hypothetical protein
MGQTVKSVIVGSRLVGNDDDVDVQGPMLVPTPVLTFTTFGTTPVINDIKSGHGRVRLFLTSGTGAGTAGVANVICTFPAGSQTPRKVYLANEVAATLDRGFYVASIAANVVNIGMKTASVASTVYNLDLIIVY